MNTKAFKCESIRPGATDSLVLKIIGVLQKINKNYKKKVIKCDNFNMCAMLGSF